MKTVTIRRPDDWYIQLRHDDLLEIALPHTAGVYGRALIAPVLHCGEQVATTTARLAVGYETVIKSLCRNRFKHFHPLMSIAITDETTDVMVRDARAVGVVAGIVRPVDSTSKSSLGVSNFKSKRFHSVLETIAEVGMVCCFRAENPKSFVMDREEEFIPVLSAVVNQHHELRVVVERVSSAALLYWTRNQSNKVAATIAVQHLLLTLDDVIGQRWQPGNFCQPIPKRPIDRKMLREAVVSGDPRFFFCSGSTPQYLVMKTLDGAPPCLFSSPVALSLLTAFFEEQGCAFSLLEKFTSENGARFYGLPLNEDKITLVRDPWTVPMVYGDGVVPFYTDKTLAWRTQA